MKIGYARVSIIEQSLALQEDTLKNAGCEKVITDNLGITGYPTRIPSKLPVFFIRFLTDPGDLVLDIYAG